DVYKRQHIRTLLLTFFYRQMRQLIENGHIYIAQPPLYKVKKGKVERYLAKEEDKDRFLLEQGLSEATIYVVGKRGAERKLTANETRQLMECMLALEQLKRTIERKGIMFEKYLRARDKKGRFPRFIIMDKSNLIPAYEEKDLANFFDSEDSESEDSTATPDMFTTNGENKASRTSGNKIIEIPEAKSVEEIWNNLECLGIDPETYLLEKDGKKGNFRVVDSKGETTTDSLSGLIELSKEIGARGVTIQRYKGLGEMNPEQLWETTMNPKMRILQQVTLEDAIEAERICSILMGDMVEPRRDFIQEHAPKVRNLDI
ncbi:MAG: hypothetical protein N2246_04235, partial [Candidatus Sumerlaeia bacterium]|nr:hypothetical protein [Candidatus Sumerlaeia bacterium]